MAVLRGICSRRFSPTSIGCPCAEQLRVLRQGTAAWNSWRARTEGLHINLNGADLSQLALPRADLNGAFLIEADLLGADLSEANLNGAILRFARLDETNLSGASLAGADLFGATLVGSNLNRARVDGAFLRHADLSGSDLSGALRLSARQVREARGDQDTRLPAALRPEAHWLARPSLRQAAPAASAAGRACSQLTTSSSPSTTKS